MSIQNTIKQQDKRMLAKAKALKTQVQIGKNGLTQASILQVNMLLKKHKLIKVKFLKSFLENNDKKLVAKKLALLTNSEIVYRTGFVVALYKR